MKFKENGETFTGAPIVVKDHLLVGNSGGELGVRGYVVKAEAGQSLGSAVIAVMQSQTFFPTEF